MHEIRFDSESGILTIDGNIVENVSMEDDIEIVLDTLDAIGAKYKLIIDDEETERCMVTDILDELGINYVVNEGVIKT